MDPSPFRQQSQNKIRSDFLRMKNEHNKKQSDTKPSKHVSAPHLSNKDSENKDPGSSENGRKAPVRPGGSRLPVLAKSLRLQTPSDFSRSHSRWEEKPLAGKTRKKKPCTRPVPFNLSQPKGTRMTTEKQQPLNVPRSRTGTHGVKPENKICNAKPAEHPDVLNSKGDSTKGTGKTRGKITENASHLSGQSGPSNTFKTSATLSHPLSSVPNNAIHQNSATTFTGTAFSAEVCSNNMNLFSLNDPSKISNASQTTQLTTQGNPSKGSTDKRENFQPDHAALLSILQNEGVSVTGRPSAAPQSKPYNCLPQRVSVMKSRQKAGPTTGSVRSVQFSPDAAALQSILQNKGVKAGGPVGATPRSSVCPPGRGTSIYTAQRVPVRKNRAEVTGGPAVRSVQFSPDAAALQSILQNEGEKAGVPVGATPRSSVCPPGRGTSSYTAQRVLVRKKRAEATGEPAAVQRQTATPLRKWTPRRVRNAGHQPMSAMKWHLSNQQSPYVTPGLRRSKSNPQLHQEEVAQRLFVDQEDEQSTDVPDKDPETQAEQLPAQASATTSRCVEKVEVSVTDGDEQEQKFAGGQMFLQTLHRDSVIFFSTGKKLFRAPRFEKQESSAPQDSPVSSEHRDLLPVHDEIPAKSETTSQINPSVLRLHRDLTVQKTYSRSPAVAMLYKRLPPLEELRMDEEVATYTSVSVPAPPGSPPPRPRCGNPLASILHFEDSTRFVPIDFNPSSGPCSPHSSPLQER